MSLEPLLGPSIRVFPIHALFRLEFACGLVHSRVASSGVRGLIPSHSLELNGSWSATRTSIERERKVLRRKLREAHVAAGPRKFAPSEEEGREKGKGKGT